MATTLYNAQNQPMTPPPPPQGFYLCGECPQCHAPLFYHGGGEAVKPPTPLEPMQAVLLPTLFLPTCQCDSWRSGEVPSNVLIPIRHDLWMEREAVIGLHSLYQDVLLQLERYHGTQLAEVRGTDVSTSEAQTREIQSTPTD